MIYRFSPILKTLVWGTETWLLSGVKGNESVVSSGPCKGLTINEIYGGEFPLLIKFIDSNEDLSIQVHPDDDLARRRHNCNGKTEMWYVRSADAGAHLLSGFKTAVDEAEFESLVRENRITDVLARHEVKTGDVFFLPAGRIHAIGGGCHIAEIQQTSDITYRIWDYGRTGLDGKPRQLHVKEAAEAIDYKVYPQYKTEYSPAENAETLLVNCRYFVTSLFDLSEPFVKDLSRLNAFYTVICLDGRGLVGGEDVKPGDVLLFSPDEDGVRFNPSDGGLKLLSTYFLAL